jgi:hypothetical protein
MYIGQQDIIKKWFRENPALVEGRITHITSDFVELNIGSEDGVYDGLVLSVVRQIEGTEGDFVVGQLRVNHVETNHSTAEVLERTAPFHKGWKVQEQPQ